PTSWLPRRHLGALAGGGWEAPPRRVPTPIRVASTPPAYDAAPSASAPRWSSVGVLGVAGSFTFHPRLEFTVQSWIVGISTLIAAVERRVVGGIEGRSRLKSNRQIR